MKFSQLLPDLPFPQPLLSETFQQHHERHLERFPAWSLMATRRKLMVAYWLKILLNHYGILLLAGWVIAFLVTEGHPVKQILIALTPASALVFGVLFLTMYWPNFHIEFLPHLDSCMEAYKGQQLEGIQQCKKEQYSVVTLMLIEHAQRQMSGLQTVLITKETIQLLARQYGVSVKSVGSALQLILRGDWDRKSLRKRTEIIDDFETAKSHFRQLSSSKAVLLLDQLQEKILQPSGKSPILT